MTIITISKIEYNAILKRQKKVEEQMRSLTCFVSEELAGEVTGEYKKKLERWSAEIDRGAGKRFSGIGEVKKYFKSLR